MTLGLLRLHKSGEQHLVTCSCYERLPYLRTGEARSLFEDALERTRARFDFLVFAYVVMPEHVHLLISEPRNGLLSDAMRGLKLSVAFRRAEKPFWTKRYHDFNVYSDKKHIEKVRYIHRNPVARGLVSKPEEWEWSSFRQYLTGEPGRVTVETGRIASSK